MDAKTQKDLEKAKTLFHSRRLLEAYQVFRRYYDRLPFKPEPEHAEYIGMFTRTLLELGKDWELKFYMTALEKLYSKTKSAEIGYQVAHVYMYAKPSQLKEARAIFQEILKGKKLPKVLQDKTKICLAYCYDVIDDDGASVKRLIDSIDEPVEPSIALIVDVWRAKAEQETGKAVEAEKRLKQLIGTTSLDEDWYHYFVAMHMLGLNLVIQNRLEDAGKIARQLRLTFEKRSCKSVNANIENLEEMIRDKCKLRELTLQKIDDEIILTYDGKTVSVNARTLPSKLLVLFAKKKTLTKTQIIKALYGRDYAGDEDDKLIVSQMKGVRVSLEQAGIPEEAIVISDEEFRLVPEVNWMEART